MNNKKLLITGFSGFVARHFVEYLHLSGMKVEICGIDVREPLFDVGQYLPGLKIHFRVLDMTNAAGLAGLFQDFTPDYILHLAAYSSVAYSWKNPAESFLNNSNIFLNLVQEVRKYNPRCRILSVGSSEEYGNVERDNLPIRENQPLQPGNPYAVARVSQEMLSKIFADAYGLDIILTRSFNHIGPRQDERFVVPSFISRILRIKRNGQSSGEIETGDITVVRDFVDVRDVVRAYYILLVGGRAGEIYNICSGKGISLKGLIDIIAEQAQIEVSTKVNPEFVRPNENKMVVGSPFKISSELGWYPKIELTETIHDMIQYQQSAEECVTV